MEPVKGRLAALIAAEAEEVKAPQGAKDRHWAAVGAAFGPMGAPPSGGSPAPGGGEGAAVGTAAKGGALLKIVGGTLVAGAIAAGVWASGDRDASGPVAPSVASRADDAIDRGEPVRTEPDTAAVPAPQEVAIEQARATDPEGTVEDTGASDPPDASPSSEPATVQPRPSRGRRATPRAPATKGEPPAAAGLAEELALVESLRRAVARGDLARAKTLAARHRREFPDGALRPDRLDLEASMHCASGDVARGRALMAELSRRWPEAPRSDRLKAACGEAEP